MKRKDKTMVQIQVFLTERGHIISWCYDGNTEAEAVRKAKVDARAKGLVYQDNYIIL